MPNAQDQPRGTSENGMGPMAAHEGANLEERHAADRVEERRRMDGMGC